MNVRVLEIREDTEWRVCGSYYAGNRLRQRVISHRLRVYSLSGRDDGYLFVLAGQVDQEI